MRNTHTSLLRSEGNDSLTAQRWNPGSPRSPTAVPRPRQLLSLWQRPSPGSNSAPGNHQHLKINEDEPGLDSAQENNSYRNIFRCLRTYLEHMGLHLNMNCGLDGRFSNVRVTYLVGLSKHRLPDPIPRISDSAWLGWRLRMCISKQVPSDVDVVWDHTVEWEPLILIIVL